MSTRGHEKLTLRGMHRLGPDLCICRRNKAAADKARQQRDHRAAATSEAQSALMASAFEIGVIFNPGEANLSPVNYWQSIDLAG
jgi:hypothetical protein